MAFINSFNNLFIYPLLVVDKFNNTKIIGDTPTCAQFQSFVIMPESLPLTFSLNRSLARSMHEQRHFAASVFGESREEETVVMLV